MAIYTEDIIERITAKLSGDTNLIAYFKKEPAATVKALVTETLTEGQFKMVLEGVVSKLAVEKSGSLLAGLSGMFKK